MIHIRATHSPLARLWLGSWQALSVTMLGLLVVAVAAVVWTTSEQLCPDPRFHWLRYLRLHSLWHICIGYGVFLLLQVGGHEIG